MNRISLMAAGVALAFATIASGAASAQSQLPGQYFDASQAPPLTVRKRAFTDSGNVAPVGYADDYVVEQTTLNNPTYSTYLPDLFGRDVLPGRFGGIGN